MPDGKNAQLAITGVLVLLFLWNLWSLFNGGGLLSLVFAGLTGYFAYQSLVASGVLRGGGDPGDR